MKLPKPTNYELAPAGNHVAVCFSIIDLGTQESELYPASHKIKIAWELSNENMADGQLFSVHKEYTFSMSKKANLRNDFISWRGRDFTSEEFETFDMENILGAPCMLNVTHRTSAAGSDYAVVSAITPLPKGTPKPKLVNEPICFAFDNPDSQAFEKLSDWTQQTIMKSPQYRAWVGGDSTSVQTSTSQSSVEQTTTDEDDDIPF